MIRLLKPVGLMLSLFLVQCGDLEPTSLHSLCGPDDLIPMAKRGEALKASWPFDLENLLVKEGAVGALQRTPFGERYCSGALIQNDLFLTAAHCVSAFTVTETVLFESPFLLKASETWEVSQLLFKDPSSQIALLKLIRKEGSALEGFKPHFHPPKKDTPVAIIQYPKGDEKKIGFGRLQKAAESVLRYDIDTLPGSSGAPILLADGSVAGLHVRGLCTKEGGANEGTSLSQLPDPWQKKMRTSSPP